MKQAEYAALPTAIAALDFSRMRQKLLNPSEGAGMDIADLDLAEAEYRRFLALHLAHPYAPLVPSKAVDAFWHAHILDTQRYADDCIRLFGHILHHDPYVGIDGPDSRRELEDMFTSTRALYEARFGRYPGQKLTAARCQGHACHAPTECACRVPEACKGIQAGQYLVGA
jgi:hypothetical protein